MTPRSFGRQPTERDFQRAVMDLAELSGWETLHVRTSMQQGRYMTATTGTMAKGWPDLVLVHRRSRHLIFAELKSDKGRLRPEQQRVHSELLKLTGLYADPDGILPATLIEVVIWRPADWDTIEATLTNRLEDSDAAA